MTLRNTIRYIGSAISLIGFALKNWRAILVGYKALQDALKSEEFAATRHLGEEVEKCEYCSGSNLCAKHRGRLREIHEGLGIDTGFDTDPDTDTDTDTDTPADQAKGDRS